MLKNQRCKFALEFNECIPIFVDVLLHHKIKKEFIFYIYSVKVHLKALLYL